MSFEKLKPEELREVAEEFGVDLPEKANKPTVIAELKESGITFDMWESHLQRVEAAKKDAEELESIKLPEPEFKPDANKVLVRMERENPRYDTQGVTFTKSHPFALLSEHVAQAIFDTEEGFRPATPKEAQEFYS